MQLRALAPLFFALSLAACQQAKEEKAPAAATENPEAKPGLAVSNGSLTLPAVKGNPGVAYFALSNNAAHSVEIAAITIEGAGKAEIHETMGQSMTPIAKLSVAALETVEFSPGAKHVMVFEIDPKLTAGSTAEMTVTFADGDKLSAPLKIVAAGSAPEGHGDMH